MLDRDEEKAVDEFILIATMDIAGGLFDKAETNKLRVGLWLAEKLKEVNHEASSYSVELYKTNKELADFRERYEG